MFEIVRILNVVGIAMIVLGVIAGIMTGAILSFFFSLLGGIVSALIFFALALILDNQEMIMYQIQEQKAYIKKHIVTETKTCSNCQYEYDRELSSCPHCGSRK